jgi:hypothetical protein
MKQSNFILHTNHLHPLPFLTFHKMICEMEIDIDTL